MTAPARTRSLDLIVRFGNQTRTKCPDCRCFMADTNTNATCGRCGAIYDRLPSGLFRRRLVTT